MKALAEICAARKSTTDMRVVVNETEEGLAFDGAPCTNPARAGGLGAPLVLWRRRDESAGRSQEGHRLQRMVRFSGSRTFSVRGKNNRTEERG